MSKEKLNVMIDAIGSVNSHLIRESVEKSAEMKDYNITKWSTRAAALVFAGVMGLFVMMMPKGNAVTPGADPGDQPGVNPDTGYNGDNDVGQEDENSVIYKYGLNYYTINYESISDLILNNVSVTGDVKIEPQLETFDPDNGTILLHTYVTGTDTHFLLRYDLEGALTEFVKLYTDSERDAVASVYGFSYEKDGTTPPYRVYGMSTVSNNYYEGRYKVYWTAENNRIVFTSEAIDESKTGRHMSSFYPNEDDPMGDISGWDIADEHIAESDFVYLLLLENEKSRDLRLYVYGYTEAGYGEGGHDSDPILISDMTDSTAIFAINWMTAVDGESDDQNGIYVDTLPYAIYGRHFSEDDDPAAELFANALRETATIIENATDDSFLHDTAGAEYFAEYAGDQNVETICTVLDVAVMRYYIQYYDVYEGAGLITQEQAELYMSILHDIEGDIDDAKALAESSKLFDPLYNPFNIYDVIFAD